MAFAVFLFFVLAALCAVIFLIAWYTFKLCVLLAYLAWYLCKLVYLCAVPWPWPRRR